MGIILCIYLSLGLPWQTYLRFVVWLAVGIVIYLLYAYSQSRLRHNYPDASDVREIDPDADAPRVSRRARGLGRARRCGVGQLVQEQAQMNQDNARATVGDAALYRNVASTSAAHGLADLDEDVEASMVIVGTTQETGLTRALLGSSTERLLHGATVPVTVVPPRWRQSAPDWISRIGVAYIDTRDAREALRMAVRVGAAAPATPTLMVDLTATIADVSRGGVFSSDDTCVGLLGAKPSLRRVPLCAPSVRLRRIRCCHMHMSHAMLALGRIEAMPSQ